MAKSLVEFDMDPSGRRGRSGTCCLSKQQEIVGIINPAGGKSPLPANSWHAQSNNLLDVGLKRGSLTQISVEVDGNVVSTLTVNLETGREF